MASQNENQGGKLTPPNRAPAAKVLAGALANNRVAQALITALGGYSMNLAVATGSSTSTNLFPNAKVGDYIAYLPSSAGNSLFGTVSTAGTVPIAIISGDLYINLTPVNLDANNPIVPAGGQLTGRTTGDGGQDF